MKHRNSAFTLLELLIVVAIIAVLVAIALPYFQDYLARSKIVAARADLAAFQKALSSYDQLEDEPFAIGPNDNPFLALIGRYIQDFRKTEGQVAPMDPWGTPYELHAKEGVLLSLGPNWALESDPVERTSLGDDLMVTWKPEFFIVKATTTGYDPHVAEVTFSRRLLTAAFKKTPATDDAIVLGEIKVGTTNVASTTQRIAADVLRIAFGNEIAAGETLTIAAAANLKAADGKLLKETNLRPDAAKTAGNEIALEGRVY